jgi:hypothetical protein
MDKLLLELLESLEAIGQSHEEIYDTECRERMGNAVFHLFIKPSTNYELPDDFGVYSDSANEQVKIALHRYIVAASDLASKVGITDFHARLAAFQNGEVCTLSRRGSFDDFFGWSPPACFDWFGNVVNTNPPRQDDDWVRRHLKKALEYFSRSLITESELYVQLVDLLEPHRVQTLIVDVPPDVREKLKAQVASGPTTEEEWANVRIFMLDANEEGIKWERARRRRNTEGLREYFGVNRPQS